MSSRACDYLGRVLEGREDFASDIAFEAADHLSLAHSLGGATTHVCVGPAIMAESDDNDAIESRIGLTIPASVEPMAVGLAGGSRYGTYTAQRGERGLGLEAFRVTPGSDQEVGRRVGSYAEDTDEGWRGRPGESIEASRSRTSLLS